MLHREDIAAIYEQGADAVVEFVERLFAQLADQRKQLPSQQDMITALAARVEEREDQLAKNGCNSSKPPSKSLAVNHLTSLSSEQGRMKGL